MSMNQMEHWLRSQSEVGGHLRLTARDFPRLRRLCCTALGRFNWYPLLQNGSSLSFLPLSAIHLRPVAKRRNLGEVEARALARALMMMMAVVVSHSW